MAKQKAVHRLLIPERFDSRKWIYREEIRDVIVMAIIGEWAMVRRPRCVPYTAPKKEIELIGAGVYARG